MSFNPEISASRSDDSKMETIYRRLLLVRHFINGHAKKNKNLGHLENGQ